MLRCCVVRSLTCRNIRLVRRLPRYVFSYSTTTSVATQIQSQSSIAIRWSRSVPLHHMYMNRTNDVSRSQTTASTIGTNHNSKKDESEKKSNIDAKEEEERLLENIEEIVDVPSSALRDVIDTSKYTDPIPIPMPDLGTSNGNSPDRYSLVKEWFFQPGDIIQHEDVLCDIETPDFTFGMETDDEGITIMGDILVPTGQPVPDGTILCYTLHESKGPGKEELKNVLQRDDDDDDDDEDDEEEKEVADQKDESEKNKP